MSMSITISGYKWPGYEHPVAVSIAGGSTVVTTVLLTIQEYISEINLDRTLAELYPEVKSICAGLCPNARINLHNGLTEPFTISSSGKDWVLETPQDLYEFNLWYEHA
jgi:hypothetical protein